MNPQSRAKRPVWLLTIVGLGTGILMLGTMVRSLSLIRADRVVGDVIQNRATKTVNSVNQMLVASMRYSTAMLNGSQNAVRPALEKWRSPFENSIGVGGDLDTSDGAERHLRESGRRLQALLLRLDRFNYQCADFAQRLQDSKTQHAHYSKSSDHALRELKASFASTEGRQLLNLANRIRKYRSLEGEARKQLADDILQSWAPKSSRGAFMTELADLAMFRERLVGEHDIDALVDIKDNKLQPCLKRLRRLIQTNDITSNQNPNERLLETFATSMFGTGFRNETAHQTVVPGTGGLYNSCVQALKIDHEQRQLKDQEHANAMAFRAARTGLLEQVELSVVESADRAAQLVATSCYRMAYVGSCFGIIFIWLARNVSNTVAAQFKAIQEQASHLELLSLVAKYTDNAVVIFDDDSKIEWTNEGFERITEYSQEEVIGKATNELLFGKQIYPKTVKNAAQNARIKNGFDVEVLNSTKYGDQIWLAIEVRPIHNSEGEAKFMAIASDITSRKKSERQITSLATLIERSLSEVFIFNSDEFDFCYLNHAALENIGYNSDEILEMSPVDIKPEITLDQFRNMVAPLKRGEIPSLVFETTHQRKDGSTYDVEVHLQNADYLGRQCFVANILDISERKKAEDERAQLAEDLQTAARQAGMAEVATGVLHNVGNILNSVNVSASLVQDKLKHSSIAKLEKASDIIVKQEDNLAEFLTADQHGRHFPHLFAQLTTSIANERDTELQELDSLVKNIEHIKEIVSRQQSFAKKSGILEDVEPIELFEDALKIHATCLVTHRIEVVRKFEEVPSIATSRHDVLQILINFIKNAIQATESCEQIERTIVCSINQDDGFVSFNVTDNGVGILAENLGNIFQHGFTTKKNGHGFGLHSGANAAQEMGGELSVQSDGAGKGATFTIKLPLAQTSKVPTFV